MSRTKNTAAAEDAVIAPVKSTARIDGVIEPGIFFVPASEAQREELLSLGAAADITDEAEQALVEKLDIPTYADLTAHIEAAKAQRIAQAEAKMNADAFVKKALVDAVQNVAAAKDGDELLDI